MRWRVKSDFWYRNKECDWDIRSYDEYFDNQGEAEIYFNIEVSHSDKDAVCVELYEDGIKICHHEFKRK